jgi:hypothetical protein
MVIIAHRAGTDDANADSLVQAATPAPLKCQFPSSRSALFGGSSLRSELLADFVAAVSPTPGLGILA